MTHHERNQEMIDEMIEMQRKYDAAVYKEFGVEYNKNKTELALYDELGEFNHEIKKSWCWWKKTQKEIDWDKTLEELVDIWHFALSIHYHEWDLDNHSFYVFDDRLAYDDAECELSYLYDQLINTDCYKLDMLHSIGLKFGFELEDIYKAYKKKNKTNWERLANNY